MSWSRSCDKAKAKAPTLKTKAKAKAPALETKAKAKALKSKTKTKTKAPALKTKAKAKALKSKTKTKTKAIKICLEAASSRGTASRHHITAEMCMEIDRSVSDMVAQFYAFSRDGFVVELLCNYCIIIV